VLKIERKEKIKTYLMSNSFANIKDLAVSMDVSTATIRRTLRELEEEGIVDLTHGGVVLKESGHLYEQPYQVKRETNSEEKRRIAAEACTFIKRNESIYLDSSSTVFEMTRLLTTLKSINIATNDIAIANALYACDELDVSVIGGVLRKHYFTLTGFFSELIMKNVFFDTVFMGFDAISFKGGLTITNSEEVRIKQMAIEASNKVIALCDHTKFEKEAFLTVCSLKDIDVLITGKELDPKTHGRLIEEGVEVLLV